MLFVMTPDRCERQVIVLKNQKAYDCLNWHILYMGINYNAGIFNSFVKIFYFYDSQSQEGRRSWGLVVVRSQGCDVTRSWGHKVVGSQGHEVIRSQGRGVSSSWGHKVMRSRGRKVTTHEDGRSWGHEVMRSRGWEKARSRGLGVTRS